VYHNPYDNVNELAHLFFKRCLEANVTPYVVTKKTVFKWQEGFWATMKKVFDESYKEDFEKVRAKKKKPNCSLHTCGFRTTLTVSVACFTGGPLGKMWR
jgi:hypothetical protein